eukprot:1743502-Pleurochrysis_carterae.AAC.5
MSVPRVFSEASDDQRRASDFLVMPAVTPVLADCATRNLPGRTRPSACAARRICKVALAARRWLADFREEPARKRTRRAARFCTSRTVPADALIAAALRKKARRAAGRMSPGFADGTTCLATDATGAAWDSTVACSRRRFNCWRAAAQLLRSHC